MKNSICFKNLTFEIVDEKIRLTKWGSFQNLSDYGFVEIQIAGENKISHDGIKMINSSEGARLCYVSHTLDENTLSIVQQSTLVRVETVFTAYDDTNAVRIYTKVTNISGTDIILEEVSSFIMGGLSEKGIAHVDNLYLTKFVQSHHAECQPRRFSFTDWGFYSDASQRQGQKKLSFANIGSWSTKEELPQGIIENTSLSQYMMFQIENSASWYYEISDRDKDIYLYLGGANQNYGAWSRHLAEGESYQSCAVALSFGNSINSVIGEMTKYRRHISGLSAVDKTLPTIFNSYMHLAWDSPTEELAMKYAPIVAKTGVEYYVIDCGWHNEEPGDVIYPYVGQWIESKARFPHGVRKVTDYIRSFGMKAGLWIEPEIVGINCKEMLDYYDDDCFFQRHGKRVAVHNRYFLDYRHPKVINYMTETIRRMVEDYGADYIKFDCNQDAGIGTDYNCTSTGEGLEKCTAAFVNWVKDMKNRFPQVVFEGCASGGMRMDYNSLSAFSLMSTSDQTDYIKYPYIAGNILSAVIPEQAAVWSYPAGECTKEEINDNQITVNMINSFLGRMHLASKLELMNEEQLGLIREGVEFYNTLSDIRHKALPYFPNGFTRFGEDIVSSGLRYESEIYLAVWNMGNSKHAEIPFEMDIINAEAVYPKRKNVDFKAVSNKLSVDFHSEKSAVFFKVKLTK